MAEEHLAQTRPSLFFFFCFFFFLLLNLRRDCRPSRPSAFWLVGLLSCWPSGGPNERLKSSLSAAAHEKSADFKVPTLECAGQFH